jgi:DNA-binding response OmpR family regulator
MEDETLSPGEVASGGKTYDLELDPQRTAIYRDGQRLRLTKAEFRLLVFFLTHPDAIFTRKEILDHIYGEGVSCTERAVDAQICGLRKKLGPTAAHLEAIRGRGYRFNVLKHPGRQVLPDDPSRADQSAAPNGLQGS